MTNRVASKEEGKGAWGCGFAGRTVVSVISVEGLDYAEHHGELGLSRGIMGDMGLTTAIEDAMAFPSSMLVEQGSLGESSGFRTVLPPLSDPPLSPN